jgi:hypothetical protein
MNGLEQCEAANKRYILVLKICGLVEVQGKNETKKVDKIMKEKPEQELGKKNKCKCSAKHRGPANATVRARDTFGRQRFRTGSPRLFISTCQGCMKLLHSTIKP